MRYFSISLIIFWLAAFSVSAQTTARGTAQIGKGNQAKPDETADIESLSIDFRNFAYPNFAAKPGEKFTLKNGRFGYSNAKSGASYNIQLRKIFYFDITDDRKTEAVVHILAEGCEDCPPRSVFYVYSAEKNQPKDVWKIALGEQEKCGLKEVRFDKSAIVLEVFGDCALKSWTISNEANPKKSDIFTRFVFNRKNDEFTEISRELLPFPAKDIPAHRSQIKFGGKN